MGLQISRADGARGVGDHSSRGCTEGDASKWDGREPHLKPRVEGRAEKSHRPLSNQLSCLVCGIVLASRRPSRPHERIEVPGGDLVKLRDLRLLVSDAQGRPLPKRTRSFQPDAERTRSASKREVGRALGNVPLPSAHRDTAAVRMHHLRVALLVVVRLVEGQRLAAAQDAHSPLLARCEALGIPRHKRAEGGIDPRRRPGPRLRRRSSKSRRDTGRDHGRGIAPASTAPLIASHASTSLRWHRGGGLRRTDAELGGGRHARRDWTAHGW